MSELSLNQTLRMNTLNAELQMALFQANRWHRFVTIMATAGENCEEDVLDKYTNKWTHALTEARIAVQRIREFEESNKCPN